MVLLRSEDGEPKAVLVVEVQRREDSEARNRWPGKVSTAYERYARYACDVFLLVICPDSRVADWAASPIVIGDVDGPGMVLRTVVVPPDGIPRLTDVDLARSQPELAVLSVLGHGADPEIGPAINRAVGEALGSDRSPTHDLAPEEKAKYAEYLGFLIDATPTVVAEQLKEILVKLDLRKSEGWRTFEPFIKAQREAEREGEIKGEARGTVRGEVRSLLVVLRKRGITLDLQQEQRVWECEDPSQLEKWLERAARAESASDVFGT